MSDVVNANQFLEELENTHIVLFHDGNNETKETECNFIKKGLENGQHCSISAILSVFSSVLKSK